MEKVMKSTQLEGQVPVWEKAFLTVNEASSYFGIGTTKIRELTGSPDCPYVLWVGSKRLIKRRPFEKFLEQSFSI